MKNLPQCYNTALTTLYPHSNKPNAATLPTREFYKFKQNDILVYQQASQLSTRAYTTMYIALKLSGNGCYFHQHKPLLFLLKCSLCITHPLFSHSNQLIFLLEMKVLTFYYGVNISHKVLTHYSKQFGGSHIHMHNVPTYVTGNVCAMKTYYRIAQKFYMEFNFTVLRLVIEL